MVCSKMSPPRLDNAFLAERRRFDETLERCREKAREIKRLFEEIEIEQVKGRQRCILNQISKIFVPETIPKGGPASKVNSSREVPPTYTKSTPALPTTSFDLHGRVDLDDLYIDLDDEYLISPCSVRPPCPVPRLWVGSEMPEEEKEEPKSRNIDHELADPKMSECRVWTSASLFSDSEDEEDNRVSKPKEKKIPLVPQIWGASIFSDSEDEDVHDNTTNLQMVPRLWDSWDMDIEERPEEVPVASDTSAKSLSFGEQPHPSPPFADPSISSPDICKEMSHCPAVPRLWDSWDEIENADKMATDDAKSDRSDFSITPPSVVKTPTIHRVWNTGGDLSSGRSMSSSQWSFYLAEIECKAEAKAKEKVADQIEITSPTPVAELSTSNNGNTSQNNSESHSNSTHSTYSDGSSIKVSSQAQSQAQMTCSIQDYPDSNNTDNEKYQGHSIHEEAEADTIGPQYDDTYSSDSDWLDDVVVTHPQQSLRPANFEAFERDSCTNQENFDEKLESADEQSQSSKDNRPEQLSNTQRLEKVNRWLASCGETPIIDAGKPKIKSAPSPLRLRKAFVNFPRLQKLWHPTDIGVKIPLSIFY